MQIDSTKFYHSLEKLFEGKKKAGCFFFLLEIKAIVLMTVLLAKYNHKKWADSPKICVFTTQITLPELPGCKNNKIFNFGRNFGISVNH